MGFITCGKSKLVVVAVGGTVLLQETDQRWRGRAGLEEGRGSPLTCEMGITSSLLRGQHLQPPTPLAQGALSSSPSPLAGKVQESLNQGKEKDCNMQRIHPSS